MKFSFTGLKNGDFLIQVTTWAGLLYLNDLKNNSLKKFFHIFQVDIHQILFSVYLLVLVKVSFDLVLLLEIPCGAPRFTLILAGRLLGINTPLGGRPWLAVTYWTLRSCICWN